MAQKIKEFSTVNTSTFYDNLNHFKIYTNIYYPLYEWHDVICKGPIKKFNIFTLEYY